MVKYKIFYSNLVLLNSAIIPFHPIHFLQSEILPHASHKLILPICRDEEIKFYKIEPKVIVTGMLFFVIDIQLR